jgi:hypothetical protein
MIASVHVADVGARSALSTLRRNPRAGATAGLRFATIALAAPLRASLLPSPDLKRVALIAFWDDDQALDRFMETDPVAAAFSDGWRARLQPVRAHGAWPGLPGDLATSRASAHEGPAAVLTIGQLRLTQTMRFLRASARAEARVLRAPGLIWATGLGRPPFVATCSLWQDTRSLATYAYGSVEPAHPDAIASGEAKPFHHRQAFIRFRPYATEGRLGGTNPLSESWLSVAHQPRALS